MRCGTGPDAKRRIAAVHCPSAMGAVDDKVQVGFDTGVQVAGGIGSKADIVVRIAASVGSCSVEGMITKIVCDVQEWGCKCGNSILT